MKNIDSHLNLLYQEVVMREYFKWFCRPGQTIDEAFQDKFRPYFGRLASDLSREFKVNTRNKSYCAQIARQIAGIESSTGFAPYADLAAGGIQFKTISASPDYRALQSMSFPAIDFCRIVTETWDTSELRSILMSKFISPLFVQVVNANAETDLILEDLLIWEMLEPDIETARIAWEDTKKKIAEGSYDSFITSKDDKCIHVRPHGSKTSYLTKTPQGTLEIKKAFWINSNYIDKNVLRINGEKYHQS